VSAFDPATRTEVDRFFVREAGDVEFAGDQLWATSADGLLRVPIVG
jgi:hypothetical protein